MDFVTILNGGQKGPHSLVLKCYREVSSKEYAQVLFQIM